jgi:hypothetical protein
MTVSPSGFCQPDAIFARNLLGATPADAVSPVASRIAPFSRSATRMPSTSPQAFSVTSRYASSSESGSTSGVMLRKMSNTVFETERYRSNDGRTMTRCGHSRTARAIGIADRTPNARAS